MPCVKYISPRVWLYERAEEAIAAGLSEQEALSIVRDAASSIEADRVAEEESADGN